MKLQQDALERIALLTGNLQNETFDSLSIENNILLIKMKDNKDYFFSNNFENREAYISADDKRRFYNINISLDNGDINGDIMQTTIYQTHNFESYEKANKEEVKSTIKAHMRRLEKEIGLVA